MNSRKRKTRRDLAKDAAEARSDLNIFYGVIALLEGGTVSARSNPHDFKIIDRCRKASEQCLRRYDRAMAALERAV